MASLIVKINNEQEKDILVSFLNSLNYEYYENMASDEPNTTTYLLSGEQMKKHLEQSMKEADNGKVTPVSINDLWK